MSERLKDKVVLIVGGTGGIGKSAAIACVAEGAHVVAIGRSRQRGAELAVHLGERFISVPGDARDSQVIEQAICVALDTGGRLDALFHVAGGSGRSAGDGPLHQISDHGWQETLDWNLSSVFYSNRAVIRLWLSQGTRGSLLNMGSVLASRPAPEHFATHAYAASKAAIVGLTLAAAASYAHAGIRCNVITPALVDTEMARRAGNDPDVAAYAARRQRLGSGRVGRASDLDGAVVFLLSDESQYVTGQVLAVDGGWSVCG